MAANAQQQANGLPILPLRNAHFRNTPSSPSSARPNVPSQLSSFGYMLLTDAMDEDLSPTFVSPLAHDSPRGVTGQMRPLSPNEQNIGVLPLRSSNTVTLPYQRSQASSAQPRPHRAPQRTPSLGSGSDASTSTSAFSATSDMAPGSSSSSTVKRKDIDGDCSICWEPFEQDQTELLYCKLTCGNNFHKKCFVEWLLTPKHQRTSPDLKCPYCRGDWDPVELRQLQIENGIIPPRPYKRPRPDHPARGFTRENMRRVYRERQRLQRDYQSYAARMDAADRYRPGPSSPQQSNSTTQYGSPPSLRATPGAPPSTPQGSPPTGRHMYSQQSYPIPLASQYMSSQHQPPMPTQFGPYLPYNVQHQAMPTMTPSTRSHDLTAAGYNAPTFAPNPFLPPMPIPQQQHMPASQQRPITRCPALQAQRATSATHPHGLNMPANPHFCPAMAPTSFEMQVNHFQYHAYYSFSGPSVP